MGTEIAISFSALREQLENEKNSLYKIDENIKKIVQTAGRYQDRTINAQGDYGRGGPRLSGRNSYPDMGNNFNKNDDLFGNKRKHETKTVFSRLSGRAGDSDGEEGEGGAGAGLSAVKRARVPSAVSRSLPTRSSVLRAQGGDEAARTRNRRIFGSLLGTLHKFKQEEITLQTKEEKKAQVERKIEEQARQEKEREQRERKTLFAERDHKKATIKALEAKMGRVHEFEKWEESQKCLGNFILTKAKPHIYWLPKKMTDKATEKLLSSRKYHEKCMERKRQELQEELQRIEQRCSRPRVPPAKENNPDTQTNPPSDSADRDRKHSESMDVSNVAVKTEANGDEDRGAKKRDKFAMDIDEKDESDGEERHEAQAGANGTADTVPKCEEGELKVERDQIAPATTSPEGPELPPAPAPAGPTDPSTESHDPHAESNDPSAGSNDARAHNDTLAPPGTEEPQDAAIATENHS